MERNVALDVIRGVAVLGILLLNIIAFALPGAAYLNPAWYGAITPADAWTWALLDAVAQVKFLTLFALLFGAGLQMLLPRGKHWITARLMLLIVLGLAHGLLLWEGDILLAYGLTGLVCWRLIRDAPSVQTLFKKGISLYLIGLIVLVLLGLLSGPEPGNSWLPDAANQQYEHFWRHAGGLQAIINRSHLLMTAFVSLTVQYGWQLAGMMLIGAALMRSGWLKGHFSQRHYRVTGVILVVTGLLINLPAIVLQWQLAWDWRWCGLMLQAPRELSAPFQATGYASLILGFWRPLSRLRIVAWTGCVGRMALSNYLLQTLICCLLFYRFDLFMKFDRPGLLAIVPGIWAVNLLFSVLWLRYFRQGPVEWLWRQLTRRASGEVG